MKTEIIIKNKKIRPFKNNMLLVESMYENDEESLFAIFNSTNFIYHQSIICINIERNKYDIIMYNYIRKYFPDIKYRTFWFSSANTLFYVLEKYIQ
jgi:hypothetical protein